MKKYILGFFILFSAISFADDPTYCTRNPYAVQCQGNSNYLRATTAQVATTILAPYQEVSTLSARRSKIARAFPESIKPYAMPTSHKPKQTA